MARRAHIVRSAVFVCLTFTVILGTAVPSAASPASELAAMRAEAAEARERLDELAADLEERSEEYLAVEVQMELTRQRITENQESLDLAERDVAEAQALLTSRVESIYRNGRVDIVSVFLGTSGFRDFVTRLEFLRRIGSNDAQLVKRVKECRATVEHERTSLENRRTELSALLRSARSKRQAVQEALNSQKAYIGSIDTRLAKLIAEERARQERLARERAAAALRAARNIRRAREFDPGALGEPHPQALELARTFVGRTPYVWGGTTPDGFDCSGLVLYCYRQIDISLPRTSREQFRIGAYIPPDRTDLLAPGDLVFFGRDGDPDRVHHVGIYAGDGMFVHAPQTGMLVSESSLGERIQTRGDYVGGVRP